MKLSTTGWIVLVFWGYVIGQGWARHALKEAARARKAQT